METGGLSRFRRVGIQTSHPRGWEVPAGNRGEDLAGEAHILASLDGAPIERKGRRRAASVSGTAESGRPAAPRSAPRVWSSTGGTRRPRPGVRGGVAARHSCSHPLLALGPPDPLGRRSGPRRRGSLGPGEPLASGAGLRKLAEHPDPRSPLALWAGRPSACSGGPAGGRASKRRIRAQDWGRVLGRRAARIGSPRTGFSGPACQPQGRAGPDAVPHPPRAGIVSRLPTTLGHDLPAANRTSSHGSRRTLPVRQVPHRSSPRSRPQRAGRFPTQAVVVTSVARRLIELSREGERIQAVIVLRRGARPDPAPRVPARSARTCAS